MKLLLDTHAVLWALAQPRKLPRRVVTAITDRANLVAVSAASTWEIAIKSALGKLSGDVDAIVRAAREAGFEELPLRFAHTVRLSTLPAHHRDPFDRILVAQAIDEGLTIVTHDPAIERYAAPTFWD